MNMPSIDEMKRLSERLAQEHAGVETRVTEFPSGCAMLDLRRDGRAFVMAFAPTMGFGVDELQPDDGLINSYRFVFSDFEQAAQKLEALAGTRLPQPKPVLSLVVLQARDLERAKEFYSLLGLEFITERHGSGPAHYAAKLGSIVFEIYPCKSGTTMVPLRVGFCVPSLESTMDALRQRGARIIKEAANSPWGRRAVVEDPDGNPVELSPSV